MRTKRNTKSIFWIIPLTVVFFCFGLLLMAQYNTYQAERDSLAGESSANLAMIIKGLNDNKEILAAELAAAEEQLRAGEELVASGQSLSSSISRRINTLQAVTGAKPVIGSGLIITIAGQANLMYYDILDLVNELFVSGAEAVAVNEIRCTTRTAISEKEVLVDAYDAGGRPYKTEDYVPTLDGRELLYPIVIKAVGDPATLETGLTYPGGIIESLNSLYRVYPVINRSEELTIPAAKIRGYQYAAVPAESENAANQ